MTCDSYLAPRVQSHNFTGPKALCRLDKFKPARPGGILYVQPVAPSVIIYNKNRISDCFLWCQAQPSTVENRKYGVVKSNEVLETIDPFQ